MIGPGYDGLWTMDLLCPLLKRLHHFLHDLIEEDSGEMGVENGTKLKGHLYIRHKSFNETLQLKDTGHYW